MEEQCSFFIDMEEKTGLFNPQGREEQACFSIFENVICLEKAGGTFKKEQVHNITVVDLTGGDGEI